MSENTKAKQSSECQCKEAFGQLIWSPECSTHEQCPSVMSGIPIRCILAGPHVGMHK